MTHQTTIRLNPSIKEQFAETCENLGLSISTAVNLFAKVVVREQRIPFEIRTDDSNVLTKAELESRIEAVNRGELIRFTPEEWEKYTTERDNA
jgi:addiction module RelB/DinJ family antitoxin